MLRTTVPGRASTCTTGQGVWCYPTLPGGRGVLPRSADGVGECPERQTEQRDVLEEELAEERDGGEAAAGRLTDPGGGEQEAGGAQEQHDGHRASHDGQFRGYRLKGQQQRGRDLEDTQQRGERIDG